MMRLLAMKKNMWEKKPRTDWLMMSLLTPLPNWRRARIRTTRTMALTPVPMVPDV